MTQATISKTLRVNATKEHVWQVLTAQPHLNTWLNELLPGSSAEGEVVEGGTVLFFTDAHRNGLKGTYTEVLPGETYGIRFIGELADGRDIEIQDKEKSLVGASERYTLKQDADSAILEIENTLPSQEVASQFDALWDKALAKIKALAESMQ